MGSDRKKKKTSPTLFAATGLSYSLPPAHKQHGTAVASQFVSPRLGCLQSSSLLSSRSILCFWTLSFFCQRVVDFVFLPPWFEHSDAAVPLVPVLAETPSIDKAVTLLTSHHDKTTARDKARSSPTSKKRSQHLASFFFFNLQRISATIIVIVADGWKRYLSTSTDFSPLTPAVCTACQDLLQCGEFPSSHQTNPPFLARLRNHPQIAKKRHRGSIDRYRQEAKTRTSIFATTGDHPDQLQPSICLPPRRFL